MNLTLFGYPRAGKTTLFRALSGSPAPARGFEPGKREPHERMVALPDARLDRLAALYPDRRRVAAAVDLVDLAGISYGEVKDSVFLNALRKADLLVHVVRAFENPECPPSRPTVDPGADIRAMEDELVLADLLLLEQRLEKLDKDLKKAKLPEGEKERDILARFKTHLEGGSPLRSTAWSETESRAARPYALLSLKPLLHLVNAGEEQGARLGEVETGLLSPLPATAVLAAAGRIEAELLEMADPSDRSAFRSEYGLGEPVAGRFYAAATALLDLILFYTIGKDEVRAWPLRRGSHAAAAAGAIHSDIERGFIRAEVVAAEDLFRHGSFAAAKDKGAFRLEGKDYVVRDGDVVYFRFAP